MGNDEKLDDLIKKTKKWNEDRGISNESSALSIDVYLDRENFELHMEVDQEKEKVTPIDPKKEKSFKYLTVKKNLSGETKIDKFFSYIKQELKSTHELEFNSKSLNLGIELENGEIIKEERGDYY